jgi:hypothetical protein
LKLDDPTAEHAPLPEIQPAPGIKAASAAKRGARQAPEVVAGYDTNGAVFARVPEGLAQQLEAAAKALKPQRVTRAEIVAALLWREFGPDAPESLGALVARYRDR